MFTKTILYSLHFKEKESLIQIDMLQIKTEIKPKSYPYLAVETFNEEIKNGKVYDQKEIIVISLIENGDDFAIYGQPLMGGKKGWIINNELNYRPLPSSYVLTLKND